MLLISAEPITPATSTAIADGAMLHIRSLPARVIR
jgi:hypothetical protein